MPFNIGPGELIIILIIALIVVGPGKLPEVGSALGKSIREFRRAATDVKESTSLEPTTARPPVAPAEPAPTPAAQAAAPAPTTDAAAQPPAADAAAQPPAASSGATTPPAPVPTAPPPPGSTEAVPAGVGSAPAEADEQQRV